jgi:hypothetical protein
MSDMVINTVTRLSEIAGELRFYADSLEGRGGRHLDEEELREVEGLAADDARDFDD